MMKILFVVDGSRDGVTLPRIVEKILGTEVREEVRPWSRLNLAGKGYQRKLQYAMRQARDSAAHGIAAIVDEDKTGKDRLKKLQEGRAKDREIHPPFPTAIGLATPHGEAWLLDDAEAVKIGLQLPADTVVSGLPQTRSPKTELERLHKLSPRSGERPLDVWPDIAKNVDLERYRQPKETGFRPFAAEVRAEFQSSR